MVEEDGGDVLLRFLFKGTNSICEGSILMFLSPPKVLTSKFYHIGDQLKYKFGGNTNIQFGRNTIIPFCFFLGTFSTTQMI